MEIKTEPTWEEIRGKLVQLFHDSSPYMDVYFKESDIKTKWKIYKTLDKALNENTPTK